MAYTSQAEIERVLPAGAVDELASAEEVQAAIDHVGATVDAYLAARYRAPFASPPAVVQTIATDLAAWRILAKGPQRSDELLTFAERGRAWIEYLRAVADGRLILPCEADGALGAGVESNSDEIAVRFDDQTLGGYQPNRQKQENS